MIGSPMKAAMNGDVHGDAHSGTGTLRELVLDLRSGKARWQETGIAGVEFPMFDVRTASSSPARLYAPIHAEGSTAPYFSRIGAFDLVRDRRQVHDYGRDVLVEEHLFVPRPGGTRPDDGWLVGTLLDGMRGRSGIAVFDARRVDATVRQVALGGLQVKFAHLRGTALSRALLVIDEVHAFANSKRGDLLSLSLARLQKLSPTMQRVGLSATISDPGPTSRSGSEPRLPIKSWSGTIEKGAIWLKLSIMLTGKNL